jgi:hypothetical protein
LNIVRAAAVTTLLVVLSVPGCSFHREWSWWYHRAPPPEAPPPPEVHALTITQGGSVAAYPQHWQRDTLLVDLQGVSGSGRIVLKPQEGTRWPSRLAFRVNPGTVGVLEVFADQRSVLPLSTSGLTPVELTLDPGVYTARTEQIAVSWRPATPVTP